MISVMVPALNEEDLLENTVTDIIEASKMAGNIGLDIIIVNDGSVDKTQEVAELLSKKYNYVRVLNNKKNIGAGESFKKVIKLVKYEKFIFIAGDNDLPRELITEIFKNSEKADLILTYFINREVRSRMRNVVSMVFQLIYMITFNIFVMYITGPCLYPTKLIKKFDIKSRRFTIPVELTIKCLLSGSSFYEIGGYKHAVIDERGALNFGNLKEVIISYIRLILEIKFKSKDKFSNKLVRIY